MWTCLQITRRIEIEIAHGKLNPELFCLQYIKGLCTTNKEMLTQLYLQKSKIAAYF